MPFSRVVQSHDTLSGELLDWWGFAGFLCNASTIETEPRQTGVLQVERHDGTQGAILRTWLDWSG
jgi:hypothetical protein